ncbi:MAG: phosphatidylglycerol lysyltransferase domain-containing protein [Candidatus Margulisiibacteriota bacterium]
MLLEDLDQIKKHLKNTDPNICEFSLANLVIWKDFDQPKATLINGNLCILITPPNEPPFFLEPIGDNMLLETVETCFKRTGKISRATENFIRKLSLLRIRVTCMRDHFDYIYQIKTLAELKGRKFDGKRNHIKNFRLRHPDYEYITLKPELKSSCLELFEEWFAIRKESRHFPKLAYTSQKSALEKTFKYYTQLNLLGGALLIDKKVKGFMIGSQLNKETVSAHFQYGHPALRGIFQTSLWEACNKTFSKFTYINLEQDLGIPGIRKAKLSYYPLRLEKKFEITPIQKQPMPA